MKRRLVAQILGYLLFSVCFTKCVPGLVVWGAKFKKEYGRLCSEWMGTAGAPLSLSNPMTFRFTGCPSPIQNIVWR
ncbi:hypothetical protein AOQ84DRAFT_143586 [Glonium stellatum]|uniref:Uncharacterized protein n=1 Tax=Glonium stellatum TaxID=574774 RepID=A0A8E2F8U8_9PEZI|nr:hypothetical protein AOQ84DRAFT_143586 [Glonium stellatum]